MIEPLDREQRLAEVTRAISSTLDIDTVLDNVVRLSAELVEADAAALGILTPGGDELSFPYTHNFPDAWRRLRLPRSGAMVWRLVETGESVLVTNYQEQPQALPFLVEFGVRGVIAVQIVAGAERLGILSVYRTGDRRPFTHRDVVLLEMVGLQAGVALQNARHYEAERRRVHELETLRATLADISAELELPRLLEAIIDRAVRLLNADRAELSLYDVARQDLETVVSHNLRRTYVGSRAALGAGVIGHVAQTRRPIIVPDYQRWEGRQPDFQSEELHAVVAAPLMAGEQLVGVISVATSVTARTFDREDVRRLELFAQQATVAIQNARLFESSRRRAEEAETLRKAASAVAATLSLHDALAQILAQLAHVVPHDSASVQLLRDGAFQIVGGRGFPDLAGVVGLRFPVDSDSPVRLVYARRAPYIVRNAPLEYPAFQIPPHDHIRSWLGVPLIFHERLIGLIAIDSEQPDHFTPHHARLASAFADQVAITLENARLLDEAHRRAEEAETLRRAGAIVAGTLAQDESIQHILQQLANVVPHDCASVQLLRDGAFEIVGGRGFHEPDRIVGLRFPVDGHNPNAAVYRDRRPVVFNNAGIIFPVFNTPPFSQTCSWLGVPLIIRGRLFGMVTIDSEEPDHFTPDHVRLASAFADQVAIALENARLFEEAQQLAIVDPLTGLYNRRHFFSLAQRLFDLSTRHGYALSAIMLDVDHFKRVNDTYGHALGDKTLRMVAACCRGQLRETDVLCRYGGEEFAILLPETPLRAARQVAERVRRAVARLVIGEGEVRINVTSSLGVAVRDQGCDDLDRLLGAADLALYGAKEAGRNCVATRRCRRDTHLR